ncbi:MAG: SDR family NAD(P)-dependent oxidoreductase [Fidelibacterota bacterium]
MISIKGKTALVTGSSRGIGQQIALGLAQLGCNIILHGRTKKSCFESRQLLQKYSIETFIVSGELSDEKQVQHLIQQIKKLNKPVDILYNNAAIMTEYRPDYWQHTWEDWLESFKVNVIAMYRLCRAFVPSMVERNFGRVINLTSGIMHQPELAPYGASKWAVNKLTDDLAGKVNDTNVRINTLDPGWCKTDLGGPNADHVVQAVLPGALAPALVDNNGKNGAEFSAIHHDLDPDLLKKLE